MKKYHVISAKRMGWDNGDNTYDYYKFEADRYSREEAIASFVPVKQWTEKNGHTVPYTAYEHDGIIYHSIVVYHRLVDESEL